MALLFIDGFDSYASADITDKWTAKTSTPPTISAGNGRNGTASLRSASVGVYVQKTVASQETWILGFAFRYSVVPPTASSWIVQLMDTSTTQCAVELTPAGTLVVSRNGTAVTGGTSVLALAANTYHYIEFKVTIADSIAAGSCKVRVNGVDWITVATGQDLKVSANASANVLRLGTQIQSPGAVDFDDFYLADGTGSVNNDFLGDVMVSALRPDGAGNSTQWTPSAGSNWQNVDEASPDDDTTYNASATAGHVDLYTLTDLSSAPASVKGIQWNAQVRKTDASVYFLNRVVRTGGADFVGSANHSPNSTYANFTEILELNPGTSAAWTGADLDALEAGIKLLSIT